MNKEELNLSMKDKELPLPEIEEEIQNQKKNSKIYWR